ncbi:uncharacterized protein LOC123709549 [Pieris brassicae]|uniref:uncharacterized protein LOC123709549 n=1 Tax=Pieris brassicae TaxID=7116 RepID=UPI001E661203|nr:uncharacterized protein LOC123709549 [Pieris brassicae]
MVKRALLCRTEVQIAKAKWGYGVATSELSGQGSAVTTSHQGDCWWRLGALVGRLVLSGHGCFGSYLHRIVGREATPACHHCDCLDDTVRHTVEECPAWDYFRSVLADSIDGNLSLPLIIQRMVEADNDGPWNAFMAFCEAVMSQKENAERQRENDSDAPQVRKRRPGQRRRVFARLP